MAKTRVLSAVGLFLSVLAGAVLPAGASTVTSWTPASPPTPQPWDTALVGVACPAQTTCMAVGDTVKAGTAGASELWNGTKWQLLPAPATTGTEASLRSVSCPSITSCIAVGDILKAGGGTAQTNLAETSDGSRWKTQFIPSPREDSGTTGLRVGGISCVSSTDCVAVGQYPRPSGYDAAYADYWNGTGWTLEAVPAPSGAHSTDQYGLADVTCFSDGACLAAGNFNTNPLMDYWNGSSWSVLASSPVGGVTGAGIDSLACASISDCTAVGYQTPSGTEAPLALGWNGSSWSNQDAPDPNTGYTYLESVSCSGGDCMAVGSTLGAAGFQDLAESWNGSVWTVTTTPQSPTSEGLGGVSCTASSACEAVGSLTNGTPTTITTAMGWNGSSWTSQPTPNVTSSIGSLTGVSCSSSTNCVAVGRYEDDKALFRGLIETGSGTTWKRSPSSTVNGTLSSVSCVPSLCMAVGDRESGKTFSQDSTGTAWMVQTIPRFTNVNSVSCSGTASCTAVGDNSSGPVAATWNGTWTASSMPVPAGATGANVAGVSCTSTVCFAVGWYDASSNQQLPLAERWNGTSWSVEALPSPGPSTSSSLASVSCFSTSMCEAVGYTSASSATTALVYNWNGTAWTAQTTPSTGTSAAYLDGVSCPSPTACTAVGSENSGAPLIEAWNGTAWTIESVSAPFGTTGSTLYAVSCTAATTCNAAGDYQTSQLAYPGTLIESET